MKRIFMDLEMQNIDSANKEVKKITRHEIIEIGAVMIDEDLVEISSFQTYIRPEYVSKFDKTVQEMTGITAAKVKDAPLFSEGFQSFLSWCMSFGEEVEIYTWSSNDLRQINREMKLKNIVPTSEYTYLIERWFDYQKIFDRLVGQKKSTALSYAVTLMDASFAGQEHDALDDARSTANVYIACQKPDCLEHARNLLAQMKESTEHMSFSLGSVFDFSSIHFD